MASASPAPYRTTQAERTPDCGYSTIAPSFILSESIGAKKEKNDTEKEIEKAKKHLGEMEKNYLLQRVLRLDEEKRRKQIKEKYANLSKELQDTNWMYRSVDDILHNKTRRNK